MMGRSFELKSAYKQLAIAKQSLSFAFVAVYNPKKAKEELFRLLAAPLRATRRFSFLRLSNGIWYIGVKALNIIWSCFFDGYVVFARDEHGAGHLRGPPLLSLFKHFTGGTTKR